MSTAGARQESQNLYEIVQRQFEKAAATLRHPEYLLRQIRTCNNIYEFHFPVRVGRRLQMFTGWRAEHSHHPQAAEGRHPLQRRRRRGRGQGARGPHDVQVRTRQRAIRR
ncbi:MAG: hypothetical protein ACYTF8_04100 [Planctomycetota bacterium]